ncbi:MAG: HAD hydrolase family protein [Planctomycetota bacterium]|jgi:3-deoxy-D-manno-octulosonate 8-phosphate phosphatase (KDO 8-P phosphatase)|nr:HAD hydrolase family protein [Planctomycetota bacterium]
MTTAGTTTDEATLERRLAEVQLLLFDCDGVLTDGGVTWANDAIEAKTFHIRDGLGIKLWQRAGYRAGIVTGRSSHVVALRAEELGITIVRQGVQDKQEAVAEILEETGLTWEQTAFVGDDLPDLACIMRCGVGVAVADACAEVRAAARLVTVLPGGAGAVREVTEKLLQARGQWQAIVSRYSA